MNQSELANAIKSFSLFQKLDTEGLLSVVQASEIENFPANTDIIKQGDHGDKVYVVLEGQVEAYVINKEGREVILAVIEKGNYFGELAIFFQGVRTSSVRSKSACKLLTLTKSKFDKLLDQHASISRALNMILSQRLGQTLNLITEKKENTIIAMLTNDSSLPRAKHFESYFKKISSKSVLIIDGDITKDTFFNLNNQHENHFIIFRINSLAPDFLLQRVNYFINFIEHKKDHIYLPQDVTDWKIENTVRKITKKTIGIALCSGGAPGAAQFGVLKVLHAAGIPLDYIVGTSVGAIAGGSYAFGHPMEKVVAQLHEIFNQSSWVSSLNLLRYLSLNFSGILKNTFYKKILENYFGESLVEEAALPFAAVASDLFSGKTVILKSGKMIDAVIASNAAPVIFEPVRKGAQLLIDGVATMPLPIQELIAANIDIKIAVPIPQLDLTVSLKKNPKLLSVFLRSRSMMAEQITQSTTALADVIISPEVKGIGMDDWKKLSYIIEAGETAATLALKRIQYLFEIHV